MWKKVSEVRPSLSWSVTEVREALAVVVQNKHSSWDKWETDDGDDFEKKMPGRFKSITRAIKQAKLKPSNKWVTKLDLAAYEETPQDTPDDAHPGVRSDCEPEDEGGDGEEVPESEENQDEEDDGEDVPEASKKTGAAQEPIDNGKRRMREKTTTSAAAAASSPRSSAPPSEKKPQDMAGQGEVCYYIGYDREQMRAWRKLAPLNAVTWATKILRDPAKSTHQPVDAVWDDGYTCEVAALTCGEYDSIKDTDDSSAVKKCVWETWPASNHRVWVARPTDKNPQFCIHQRIDSTQSQMVQVKTHAFGSDDASVEKAEVLAIQLATDLASKKMKTREELKKRRDEVLPKTEKHPRKREAESEGTAAASTPADATLKDAPDGQPSTKRRTKANAKPKLENTQEAPVQKESAVEATSSKMTCGFCDEEADDSIVFEKHHLCTRCFVDAGGEIPDHLLSNST